MKAGQRRTASGEQRRVVFERDAGNRQALPGRGHRLSQRRALGLAKGCAAALGDHRGVGLSAPQRVGHKDTGVEHDQHERAVERVAS